MAKKYFEFDYLSQKGTGIFKPYGTMGTHYCEILLISEKEIVVKGNKDKTVKLFPGWTLGYDCGEVWAIKPASEIKNPLHKWAREHKISLKNIIRTNDPIQYGTESRIIGAGWGEIGDYLTYYGGESHSAGEKYEWVGGIVAYRTQHSSSNGNPTSYPDAIFIREGVSDEEAASYLAQGFTNANTNQKLRIFPETWGEFLTYYNQLDNYSQKKILCLACNRDWFDFDFYHKQEMIKALKSLPTETKIPPELKEGNPIPILIWDKEWILANN
jgi:hypothetical protein